MNARVLLLPACLLWSCLQPALMARPLQTPDQQPFQIANVVQRHQPSDTRLRTVLQLTNAQRTKAGLPALIYNPLLQQAAQKHAMNMAKKITVSHNLDGKGVSQRVTAEKYIWNAVAENIAKGQTSAAEVVSAWMNSPGHKANILAKTSSEIGLGIATDAKGQLYWVQVFGNQRKAATPQPKRR